MKKIFLLGFIIISSCLTACREDIVKFDEIEKDNGSVYINSNPAGAEIFFEDVKTNLITPKEFEELAPGEYIFTLKLEGYKDTTIVAEVKSGKNNFVSILLKRK